MIAEIAVVEILSGREPEFEEAIKIAASTVLVKSPGFLEFKLHRGIERSDVYTFVIHWETLEDHTVGFRNSELFTEWRSIIGQYFANPPAVEHWIPLWNFPNS